MQRYEYIQCRVEPQLRQRLARLRTERDMNVSAWLRRIISEALDREFPTPEDAPIPGWIPCRLDDGWGSVLSGPAVDSLPEDLIGALIAVTDRSGNSWTTTVTAVIERSHDRLVVTDSGRPR